jgi:hypothetical protein
VSRRKGRSRDGLFTWTPTGVTAAEVRDNGLAAPCAHCHALAGEPCTRPGPRRRRRIVLREVHPIRRHPSTPQTPQEQQ